MRIGVVAVAVSVLAVACGSGTQVVDGEPLPPITPAQFALLLQESEVPVVANIWASWCVPCRSEAPLLRQAHEKFGDEIRFIGIDVQDSQGAALAFLAEFGLTYENYFDPNRSVPNSLGGFGVPITYFFAPGGDLTYQHTGVIDERTLALNIDEILRR
jgi:cytochrome c biogenesis protein CcmG/thiol:disulfide interchange protein DsbE